MSVTQRRGAPSSDFSQKCKLEKWTKMTPKFSQNSSKNARKAAMQRGLPCCGAGLHGPMNTPPIISASSGAATLRHLISVEPHAAFKICYHSSHPAPRGSGEKSWNFRPIAALGRRSDAATPGAKGLVDFQIKKIRAVRVHNADKIFSSNQLRLLAAQSASLNVSKRNPFRVLSFTS